MNKIIGYWTISNFGGIAVVSMDDESMVVKWFDEPEENHTIIYEVNEDTEENEPCIDFHGTKYFLFECMRMN